MRCPYCGSTDVVKVKEWDMPKQGYHVTYYVCRSCGGRFNHYVGRGREFTLRVGLRRKG
jgi:DNA-directed RNA polymerase subunit RPC12/RpoP